MTITLKMPSQIEEDADRRARLGEGEEADEAAQEEGGDDVDQPPPWELVRERAVDRHRDEKEERLARGGVALHLGPAAREDQRLAQHLHQRIGAEQEKDVGRQEEGRSSFRAERP